MAVLWVSAIRSVCGITESINRCIVGLVIKPRMTGVTSQCFTINACSSSLAYDCTMALYDADVDECAENNGGCSPHANCTNIPGNFTCTCMPGYTGDGFSCSGDSASCFSAVWINRIRRCLFVTHLQLQNSSALSDNVSRALCIGSLLFVIIIRLIVQFSCKYSAVCCRQGYLWFWLISTF